MKKNSVKKLVIATLASVLATSALAASDVKDSKDRKQDMDLRIGTQSKMVDKTVGSESADAYRAAQIERMRTDLAKNPSAPDARAVQGILDAYDSASTLNPTERSAVYKATGALARSEQNGNFSTAIAEVSRVTGAKVSDIEEGCGGN